MHRADGHTRGDRHHPGARGAGLRCCTPAPCLCLCHKRSTRLKVLVYAGIGIWLADRRLHEGRFIRPGGGCGAPQSLTREQPDALALGLPWQRVGEAGVITLA